MSRTVSLAPFAALAVDLAVVLGLAGRFEYRPEPVEAVRIRGSGGAGPLRVGEPFSALSWNLQFAGGRRNHFFYDGGTTVEVPPAHVAEALAGITDLLRAEAPALALLQEIDRDSARTGYLDQLPALLEATRAAAWTTTPYMKSPFVPAPLRQPLGRVRLDLGILSRVALRQATRTQLALLDEPRYRQIFNLKRALLSAEVPVEGLTHPLAIGLTHLSAFSRGDGTLDKQARALLEWVEARPVGQPWILAGDLNMLPPGDDPARLGGDAHQYADQQNPIARLLPRLQEVFGANQLDPSNRTYLPWGASEPDRKIDYLFYGGPIELVQARVVRGATQHSDHLPIVAVFVVGSGQL